MTITRIPPTDEPYEPCAIIRSTHFQYHFFPEPIGESNHAGKIIERNQERANEYECTRFEEDRESVRLLRLRLIAHAAEDRNTADTAWVARDAALGKVIEVLDGLFGELEELGKGIEWTCFPFNEEEEEANGSDDDEDGDEDEDEDEEDDDGDGTVVGDREKIASP
ncbi:MAG: hypothetical protein Q9208_008281 [Pyrenodesmia sp. 3 TL-2023]